MIACRSATAVDSSTHAIAALRRNITLNQLPSDAITCVQQDVMKYLRSNVGRSHDIVVCDPPKFAPSSRDLTTARSKYRKLNAAAMSAVREGGLLLTCSCSGAVAQSEKYFVGMLQEAAVEARRDIAIVASFGAAPDHPIHASYLQGRYLTAMLLRVI